MLLMFQSRSVEYRAQYDGSVRVVLQILHPRTRASLKATFLVGPKSEQTLILPELAESIALPVLSSVFSPSGKSSDPATTAHEYEATLVLQGYYFNTLSLRAADGDENILGADVLGFFDIQTGKAPGSMKLTPKH